jgi:hypothetical protein
MNQSTKIMNTQTYKKTSIMPIQFNDKTIPVKLESQEYPIRIVFIGGGRIVAEIVDICMN